MKQLILKWKPSIEILYLKLMVLLYPQKCVAVYFLHTMHFNYLKDTIEILKKDGIRVFIFIKNSETKNELRKVYNHRIYYYNYSYLNKIAFRLVITPATIGSSLKTHSASKKAHIYHSMVSSHTVYPDQTFQDFDFIFCTGPHHVNELKMMLKNDVKKHYLAHTGYEIIDRMITAQKKENFQKNILFAPSWGENNSLKLYGLTIIEKLIDEYKIIVRPHVMTKKFDPELIKEIKNRFIKHPNFVYDETQDSLPSMLESNLMITDFSGVAFEYALAFKKPVIFIDVPRKINNPHWNLIIKTEGVEVTYRDKLGYIVQTPSEIKSIIDQTILEQKIWQQKLQDVIEELLYYPGLCAQNASFQIKQILLKNYSTFEQV